MIIKYLCDILRQTGSDIFLVRYYCFQGDRGLQGYPGEPGYSGPVGKPVR